MKRRYTRRSRRNPIGTMSEDQQQRWKSGVDHVTKSRALQLGVAAILQDESPEPAELRVCADLLWEAASNDEKGRELIAAVRREINDAEDVLEAAEAGGAGPMTIQTRLNVGQTVFGVYRDHKRCQCCKSAVSQGQPAGRFEIRPVTIEAITINTEKRSTDISYFAKLDGFTELYMESDVFGTEFGAAQACDRLNEKVSKLQQAKSMLEGA